MVFWRERRRRDFTIGDVNPNSKPALTSQANCRRLRVETASDMNQHKQPSKETVRQWLRDEIARRRPPPELQQIRAALGWEPGRAKSPKKG
jgi:hypothetical protein